MIILVLLAVAFLIIVQRNLLNLSDFLHTEKPGMVIISVSSLHCSLGTLGFFLPSKYLSCVEQLGEFN